MKQLQSRKHYRHYLPAEIVSARTPVPVLLIGAGGNGGPTLTGLARMNHALRALGHAGLSVSVFDPDRVQSSNVGRQLYSVADIGRNKVECLVTRINHFCGLRWKAFPFEFGKDHVGQVVKMGARLIITAVDRVKPRQIANEAARKAGAYFLDMGNLKSTGQIVLGTGHHVKQPAGREDCIGYLPTILDLYPDLLKREKDVKSVPTCGMAEALEAQSLFINTAVSTYAMHLLWEAFRQGYVTEHGVFVNLETKRTSPLAVDPEIWRSMGWERAASIARMKAAA